MSQISFYPADFPLSCKRVYILYELENIYHYLSLKLFIIGKRQIISGACFFLFLNSSYRKKCENVKQRIDYNIH